jgi:hypothetical protein
MEESLWYFEGLSGGIGGGERAIRGCESELGSRRE